MKYLKIRQDLVAFSATDLAATYTTVVIIGVRIVDRDHRDFWLHFEIFH